MKALLGAITGAALLVLSACGPQTDTGASSQPDQESGLESTAVVASMELPEMPEQVLTVAEARRNPVPGETLAIRGQIGGTVHPFTQGYATFVLADESLVFCDEMGDADHCPTPWDACCEDPDKLAASRASVQFLAGNGRPFPFSLKGVAGLKESDALIVTGTVAEGSNPDNLIINANGFYSLP